MRALALLSLTLVALAPALAAAQSADALIDEGISLREQHRDAEALDRFALAHELEPSGRALAQIALAEQALGRFVAAHAHLEEALADDTDRFIERNRTLLEQALSEIAAHLGELDVRGPPDAMLRVDGALRARLPLAAPLRLEAGPAQVEVRLAGHAPFAMSVEITAGERAELDAVLRPLPIVAARPLEPSGAARSPEWLLPTGIAAASVGAVGLVIATALLVVREDHAQARLSCNDTDPACRDRYQAALDAESAAITMYVVGGTIAAAGVALVLLDALGIITEERADEASIACAPGTLSIACRARF